MGQHGHAAGTENLRFSRRLVAYHVSAIAILIVVVVGSLLWVSGQHNLLARASAEKMVRGGIASFEQSMKDVVLDYSVWTEAYDAILAHDMDWIYSNLGTGAAETGALDMIVIVEPGGDAYGWQSGTGPEGETGLIPPGLLRTLLGLLDGTAPDGKAAPVAYAELDGEVWAFAVTRVVSTEGTAGGATDAGLPRQVQGLRVTDALLGEIGAHFLMDDLALGGSGAGAGALPLLNAEGEPLASIVWTAPAPGEQILRRTALPLAIALLALVAIAAVLSRYAVRSARRLEGALVAAEAASRSKTEFLASVSHELRTPMHGIIGIGQLLARTKLDEGQREMLGALMKAADSQTLLIDDLLDISAIESGRRVLEVEPFEPARILGEVVDLARPAGQLKGLSLRLELDGMSRAVMGDVVAFRQIMTNLVGNAVKFTDAGRIDVAGRLTVRQGEAVCTVAISDTGPGIHPTDQERIFERFTQADASLSREADGAGLGLWISRRLAEMMGGTIRVESVLGEGATFIFESQFELLAAVESQAEAA